MKCTVLTDNYTRTGTLYLGEPGFSCLLEADGETVLFDTGYSDVFLRNADKLGLKPEQADMVVLSHGHDDHTGGLQPLLDRLPPDRRPQLVAHPGVFARRIIREREAGCPLSQEALSQRMDLRLSAGPVWLTEHLVFLGEIPELVEQRAPCGVLPDGTPDRCLDDSALAYVGSSGVYLLTGCSHSGICNMAEYAKQVTGQRCVAGILGGFHLLQRDERSRRTIAYLDRESVAELWPCHCTCFKVRMDMARSLEIGEVSVGMTLEWS